MTLLPATAFAAEGETERGVLKYSVAIEAKYEDAGAFSEGLAAVKQNGKWGYIDTEGKTVVPFQYDLAYVFNEGYAVVGVISDSYTQEDMRWDEDKMEYVYTGTTSTYNIYDMGFIDPENHLTWFIDPEGYDPQTYEPVDDMPLKMTLKEGANYDQNRRFFYNGYICLPAYDYPGYFLFGTDGKSETFGLDYVSFYDWQVTEGYVITGDPVTDTGSERFLNIETGEFLEIESISDEYYYVSLYPFNQGIAPVWHVSWDEETWEENWKIGFINTKGEWIIKPQYTSFWRNGIYSAHEVFGVTGLAMVANAEGKYGAIDKSGKTVIPFKYDSLQPYHFGLAVYTMDGLSGCLDEKGKVAIEPKYEQITAFNSDGYAVAYDGNNALLIDTKGNEIPGANNLDPDTYFRYGADGSITVYAPSTYVVIEENGKYGFGYVEYLPALPAPGDMDTWAYEEVVAAIEEGLVPTYLQNLYKNNINRNEFCDLVVETLQEVLEEDIAVIVEERTGKSLAEWEKEYPFKDSTSSTVIAAYALGVVNGRGNGVFDPYMTITREEAAAFLMRSAGVLGMDTTQISDANFADEKKVKAWFKDAVNFVYQIKVMNGTGGDNFTPAGTYTREQSFMTIYRLFLAVSEM